MNAECVIAVQVRKGVYAYVDVADAEVARQHKWHLHASGNNRTKYAITRIDRRVISLHRLLMGDPAGLVVDHINGNGLDNRRANLRAVTKRQNCINSRPSLGRKFKGVTALPNGRFRAWVNGTFATEEEAARAFDRAAFAMHGEFAFLNFGDEK